MSYRFFSSTLKLKNHAVTVPLEPIKYRCGDIVEFIDYFSKNGGIFNLGLVRDVQDGVDSWHKTLHLLTKGNGIVKKETNYVRFHSPRPPTDKLRDENSAFETLNQFELLARNLLLEYHEDMERAISKQVDTNPVDELGSANLIYELDVAKTVFGEKFTQEQIYATHLYLHSYSQRYGRDLSYGITAAMVDGRQVGAAGPYYRRSAKDLALIKRLKKDRGTPAPRYKRFLSVIDDINLGVCELKMLRDPEFADYLLAIQKACMCHWLDTSSNPFVEFVQATFKGLIPWRAKNLAPLLKRYGLEDLTDTLDVPQIQSGLQFNRIQTKVAPIIDGSIKGLEDRFVFDKLSLSIDPESTVEVDDAISIEIIDKKTWLHVHVADPSRLVKINSECDILARNRASSIYLPQFSIGMLPPEISSLASLDPNRKYNGTMTFSALLGLDGDIVDYKVTLGVATNIKGVDYESADASLETEGESETSNLLRQASILTNLHRRHRLRKGYFELNVPKGHPKVRYIDGAKPFITFQLETSLSPSRKLVAEAMIIAGRIAAMYAKDYGLAVPFRYHENPAHYGDEEFATLLQSYLKGGDQNATTFEKIALLERFKASAIDVIPRPHWAMAIPHYAKSTSPLRRYFDLLLHYQLHSSLKSELPQSKCFLAKSIPPIYRHERYLKRLEGLSRRFWTLRYIEQLLERSNKYKTIPVTVVPLKYLPESNTFGVFIEEFALRQFCNIPGGSTLITGVPIKMNIVAVDPLRNEVKLSH